MPPRSGSGAPQVSVPVLSKTTWSMRASRSSAVPDFTMTPRRIRRPLVTAWTMGTASPKAQGQVTMSTAMAISSASCQSAPPIRYQPRKLATLSPCTIGA